MLGSPFWCPGGQGLHIQRNFSDRFFSFFHSGDSGGPGRGQLGLLRVSEREHLPANAWFLFDEQNAKTCVSEGQSGFHPCDAAAGIARMNTIWILLAAGAAGLLLNRDGCAATGTSNTHRSGALSALAPLSLPIVERLFGVTSTLLKIGFVFFGGGFVLVPLLHERLVTPLHWLTEREFLEGVAISNFTPGPLAVLATFAGLHVAYIVGGLAATVALFAPGVALMLVISHQSRAYARIVAPNAS